MRKLRNVWRWAVVAVLAWPVSTLADDSENPRGPMAEEPSYRNAAQAMHAANVAEADWARTVETALQEETSELSKLADEVERTRAAYEAVSKTYDMTDTSEPNYEELGRKMLDAKQAYDRAEEKYSKAIGDLAGVAAEDIYEMRQEGMGWGRITRELGLPSGILGLGRTGGSNRVNGAIGPEAAADVDLEDEIAEATRRDPKTGWNSGRGPGVTDRDGSSRGLGLSGKSAASGVSGTGKTKGPGRTSDRNGSLKTSAGNQGPSGASSASSGANNGRGRGGGPADNSQGAGPGGNSAGGNGSKGNNGKGNSGKGNSGQANGNGKK